MEILLIIAIVAVSAAALYVAATFDTRTKQAADPLITDAVTIIAKEMSELAERLRQDLGADVDQLTRNNLKSNENTHNQLARVASKVTDTASRFVMQQAGIKDLAERIDGLRAELAHKFDESIAGQNAQIAELATSVARLAEMVSRTESAAAQIGTGVKDVQAAIRGISDQHSYVREGLAALGPRIEQLTALGIQRDDFERWTSGQQFARAQQAKLVERGQGDIESYLRFWLDYAALPDGADRGGRVMTASFFLKGPGAELIWPLLLSFCRAMNFKMLRPAAAEAAGRAWYLLWRSADTRGPAEVLHGLLQSCLDDQASPSAELNDLRSIALALHAGGPGTIRLGPMIINRTSAALLGCALTAAQAGHIGGTDIAAAPDACAAAMREHCGDRLIDMTSWADAIALRAEESEGPGAAG
jgi:hypothetical protein